MTETLYSATATASGGRAGHVTTSDARLDLQLSVPKGIGGDDGPGTNPEQLFAAGYAACFHSALKAISRAQKIDVTNSAVSVTVGMIGGPVEGFNLTVKIEALLPGLDRATAQTLVASAHQGCPYSRATRGNIQAEVVLIENVG